MNGDLEQVVEALRGEQEKLRAENGRLREELEAAYRRIAELERAAARQAAPFRRPEKDKVPPERKNRPGRKPGHPGTCRVRPRQVDHQEGLPWDACPRCGGPVTDRAPLVQYPVCGMQYVEEIPPWRPEVTRLTTCSGHCPCCGEVFSSHPLQTSRGGGRRR